MTARTGAARVARMLVLGGLVMLAVVLGLFGPALVEDLSSHGSKLTATKRRFERLLAYAQWRDKRTKALVKNFGEPPKPAPRH